jgi:hypothetical protein
VVKTFKYHFHFRLLASLESHIERVTAEIANLESVEKGCKDLHEKLGRLQKEVVKLDVWSKEQQPVADGLKVTMQENAKMHSLSFSMGC